MSAFDYAVKWIVGEEKEILTEGSFSGILISGENETYNGQFTPKIFGSGNVSMHITNIVWMEAEPITWTYVVNNPHKDFITIQTFEILGASETYVESGTVIIYLLSGAPSRVVTFELTLPEYGTLTFTDIRTNLEFLYEFEPLTVGGELTATLDIKTFKD